MPAKKEGYKEILNLVETFMKSSGIRKYCSEICKGRCCARCYDSENACHRTDGRRLTCSAFICYNLRKRVFNEEQKDLHFSIEEAIMCALKEADSRRTRTSCYFNPIPREVQNTFKADPSMIMELIKDADKIRLKVECASSHPLPAKFGL